MEREISFPVRLSIAGGADTGESECGGKRGERLEVFANASGWLWERVELGAASGAHRDGVENVLRTYPDRCDGHFSEKNWSRIRSQICLRRDHEGTAWAKAIQGVANAGSRKGAPVCAFASRKGRV